MPHVEVKCYPGKSEEQKKALAEKITSAVQEAFGNSEASISVAIKDVPSEEWKEKVWDKEIVTAGDTLYKKPGYNMDK